MGAGIGEYSVMTNLIRVLLFFVKYVGFLPPDYGYRYNTALAEGAHNYPHGIHKYYDMFSLEGYFLFASDYFVIT